MGLLSDRQIQDLIIRQRIVERDYFSFPLCGISSDDVRKIMGSGIDSYGFDVTLGENCEIFTNVNNGQIFDPKRPNDNCRIKAEIYQNDFEQWMVLPPNGFMLGHTPEYIRVPRECAVLVMGKSSYARGGIIINPTVLKPNWEGEVVLEISNSTPIPVKIYINEGIAHLMYILGDQECDLDYLQRGGKYQGQSGITMGKV